MHSSFVLAALILGGCSNPPPAEEPVTDPASEPSPEGSAPTEPLPAEEKPAEDAPVTEGEAAPASGASGRLAFIECTSPRKTMCTKEYRPVCGEVDTGIRCIKEPCPSTEKKQFGNACMACADEKVVGYFAKACDELGTEKAP